MSDDFLIGSLVVGLGMLTGFAGMRVFGWLVRRIGKPHHAAE